VTKPYGEDLTASHKDYAVFLPAISGFYQTYVSKQQQTIGTKDQFVPDDRIPKGFENGIEGLNYFNKEKGYFNYKYGLYSAGHAHLDVEKSIVNESMFHTRDKKETIVVGDSGGYQIGKGVLKFDWQNFKGQSANAMRDKILHWLELTADWSMVLDIPSWASDATHSPKTGLKSYGDCIAGTVHNNEYFLKNRLGQTKFLNVLQGFDIPTGDVWYDAVKHFPFEGWAFGGNNMCDMTMALRRLIILRDSKLLDNRDWIHFLGTSKLDWACFLTAIQRQLREHVNPNLTVSYDSASAFVATAHGLVYTSPVHTNKRWSYIMDKATDSKSLKLSTIPFPWESEIGRRLTIGDICWYGPGDLNKVGKEGKTSWDSFAYALMMGHNVNQHIKIVQKANQITDIESVIHKPDYRHWRKAKQKETSVEFSDWCPRNVLYFNAFVEDFFKSETPMQMLEDNQAFLHDIRGVRWTGQSGNNFSNLFDIETQSSMGDADLGDPNDEKLEQLEKVLETV